MACPFGYMLDENNNCVKEKPCDGDPLQIMEISDYNSGKNANRFGCVRVKINNTCDGKTDTNRHGGIDLKVPIGSTVYSLTNGTVYLVQENHPSFGNWIIIKSGNLFYTYAHLDEVLPFSVGQSIYMYDQLGVSGDSGDASNEPHLHLEIKRQTTPGQSYNNSSYENPENYLGTQFDLQGNTLPNQNC